MGYFDDIPSWAQAKLSAPALKPDEAQQVAKARAEMATAERQALAEFNGSPEVPMAVKRKPGRPRGAKDTKPRARLPQPGTAPDGDA